MKNEEREMNIGKTDEGDSSRDSLPSVAEVQEDIERRAQVGITEACLLLGLTHKQARYVLEIALLGKESGQPR